MPWVFLGLVLIFVVWAIYALIPTLRYKYFHSNRIADSGQSLLLTFDDGPDPRYTPRLLDILAKHEIKAVFFLPGFKVEQHAELVKGIVAGGHQIGFHGMVHKNPWALGPRQTKADFNQGMEAFARIGLKPGYYRPPHGNVTWANLAAMKRQGLELMLWSVIVGDWQNCGKDRTIGRLISQLHDGAVILLHDAGEGTGGMPDAPEGTLEAVDAFIPWAIKSGYRFIDPQKEFNDGKQTN